MLANMLTCGKRSPSRQQWQHLLHRPADRYNTPMPRDTDASYKLLFSAPEVVRDLVLGFIPDDWLHSLDYTTLEKIPGSYITDDLRDRADDVVWRVKADGEWVRTIGDRPCLMPPLCTKQGG